MDRYQTSTVFWLISSAGRKVQQETLIDDRANFVLPKGQWADQVIEARLAGNECLFEPAVELVATGETIVQRLQGRELAQPMEALDCDTAHVQLGSVEIDNASPVGCENLAQASLDARGLPGLLKDVGLSGRDAQVAMALVIVRIIHRSCEREALWRLETSIATLELLRLDTGRAHRLDKLLRFNGLLVKHHKAIEDALFVRQRDLLGNVGAVIFHTMI